MLTVALIATVFYFHPSTLNATTFFRTIPILPETNGRVAEVFVGLSGDVKQGQPIFRLDDTKQRAALEVAKRRIEEVEAQIVMASADIVSAEGQIQQAKAQLQQAIDELQAKEEINRRSPDVIARREIEKLQVAVEGRKGGVTAAEAAKQAAETRLNIVLPAEKASAVAARDQAQVDLDKTVVYAGVSGRVEQFVLRVGDIVNPFMRPAGVLVPEGSGRRALVAGFGQIEAHVMKPGMIAEATCIARPWTIIPMVVTQVQDYIAAGQVRTSEQLIDAQQVTRPGTVTTFLEPLFKGSIEDIPPGSSCIVNAYSNHHDEIVSKDTSNGKWLALHVIDAVALVHALILRLQAAVLPIRVLVLGGH
jgi:multidrug resistance efflux pump